MHFTTTTSTTTATETAMVNSIKETKEEKEAKVANELIALNFLMPNVKLKKQYSLQIQTGILNDPQIKFVLGYVGSVISFLSCFNSFISQSTDSIKARDIKKYREELLPIIPHEYKNEKLENILDLSKLVYLLVRKYSLTMLLALNEIRMLPSKVEQLKRTLNRYQKRKKTMSVEKMGRLINLDTIKTHFQSLESVCTAGQELSLKFFNVYIEIGGVQSKAKDYLKQIQENTSKIIELKKELAEKLDLQAKREVEAKKSFETARMLVKHVNDLEKNYKDGKSVWVKVIDHGIERAKNEKSNAEERLRDYTYKAWGPFKRVWENDVKLAQEEVDKWTKELQKLRDEKKSGYSKKKSDDQIIHFKKESSRYTAEGRKQEVEAAAAKQKAEAITVEIKKLDTKLKEVKNALDKARKGLVEENESTDRLISAMDATRDFAYASQSQVFVQKTTKNQLGGSAKDLFWTYEDLFEEESIDDQLAAVDAIEEENDKFLLIKFLADALPMQEYPMVERTEFSQLKNSIKHQLLENKKE